MKEFEYFVKTGAVKKQSVDMNLAKATRKESSERLLMAKSILQTQKAKYALENAYESIREDIDAILFSEGFKSFSHEATISFLQKFKEFSAEEISDFAKKNLLPTDKKL